MKLILINLRTAIRKGILRIFPLPRFVLYLFAIVVACTLIGCATPKQVTQLVRNVERDTIYLNKMQYDSIYIYKEHNVLPLPDSIHLPFNGEDGRGLYIKDVSVEYRYKMLRDTVRQVERDSIPYEVTITEVKEIQRPLTAYDKACRITFWFVIGFLLSFIVMKFRRGFYCFCI